MRRERVDGCGKGVCGDTLREWAWSTGGSKAARDTGVQGRRASVRKWATCGAGWWGCAAAGPGGGD